jgi:hypothetical protein
VAANVGLTVLEHRLTMLQPLPASAQTAHADHLAVPFDHAVPRSTFNGVHVGWPLTSALHAGGGIGSLGVMVGVQLQEKAGRLQHLLRALEAAQVPALLLQHNPQVLR